MMHDEETPAEDISASDNATPLNPLLDSPEIEAFEKVANEIIEKEDLKGQKRVIKRQLLTIRTAPPYWRKYSPTCILR